MTSAAMVDDAPGIHGWIAEHPVRPDAASGMYVRPDGATAWPASRLIDWAYPPVDGRPERSRAIRAACAIHARHLAGRGPVLAVEQQPEAEQPAIERLIGHRFWQRLEVLGAPVHAADPLLPLATTVDLVVRFREGGGNGVAMVQTAPPGMLQPSAVMAELGAALLMLGDAYRTLIGRAFVIWVAPTGIELQMLDADRCTIEWVEAIGLSRWGEKHPGLVLPGCLRLSA